MVLILVPDTRASCLAFQVLALDILLSQNTGKVLVPDDRSLFVNVAVALFFVASLVLSTLPNHKLVLAVG